jgi:cyclopropane-fatty-acyl-phospholipid synthase
MFGMLTIAPLALPRLLDMALARYFSRTGSVTFVFPDGTRHTYGPTNLDTAPVIRFSRWRDLAGLAHNPSLTFGDGYTNGTITAEPVDLDRFLTVVAHNRRTGPLARALHRLRLRPPNYRRFQRRNIGAHYDGGDTPDPDLAQWYRDVLGPTQLYTCARFDTAQEDLDEAQEAKVLNIARKLGLDDDHTDFGLPMAQRTRLLDIGCGWGYIACLLAERFGVRVDGITIAQDQIRVAEELAQEMGVQHLVTFKLVSYQEYAELAKTGEVERYDGVYSVGMVEHVPHAEYAGYFAAVKSLLVPGGVFMLHGITNQFGGPPDPFVVQRIFPGSRLGAPWQLHRAAVRSGFMQQHYENLAQHYVRTCELWLANHRAHRDEIIERLGSRFYYQREFWLAASVVGFRDGDLSLSQFVFTNGKPPYGTWRWNWAGLYHHLRDRLPASTT